MKDFEHFEHFEHFDENGVAKYRFDQNPKEETFVKEWGFYKKSSHLLEYLLSSKINEPQEYSQRDNVVANRIVQWLGSPCGQAFLKDVEKRHKTERSCIS